MDKHKNYFVLKKFCLAQGADLFGVADITELKKEFKISPQVLKKLDKAVCLGMRLSASILEDIENAPTRLYFHHYKTVNTALDQLALEVTDYIQKRNYLALPIPASQILDWQNQTAHLSHKKIGYLAGLGWRGRNNLLVNDNFGSQFRLVSVLTNFTLKTDQPVKKDCGDCKLCVTICPSGAIKESPLEFTHFQCFEKLKEFQRQRLVNQYICGICLKVCPGKSSSKLSRSKI